MPRRSPHPLVPLALFSCIAACGESASGTLGDAEPQPIPDAGPRDTGVHRDASLDAGPPDVGEVFDPNCQSCRVDGQTCVFSINCQPGSICNDPADPLYDPSQPDEVCLKVACTIDADCMSPKVCSLRGICEDPVCTGDIDCPGTSVCLGGRCIAPPPPGDVVTCSVVSPETTLRTGQSLELHALAFGANGLVLPGVEFTWSSGADTIASVSGSTAVGGAQTGIVLLFAHAAGNPGVSCSFQVVNLAPAVPGTVRVSVYQEGNWMSGATVALSAGTVQIDNTDIFGRATFTSTSPIDWVSATNGLETITVLSPGTADIELVLPPSRPRTRSAGFRGSVGVSAAQHADVGLAFAASSLSGDLMQLFKNGLCGESVLTTLDAPELGLNSEDVDLPAGLVISLGEKKLTADGSGPRCGGLTPGVDQVGCYLARGEGVTAGWTIGGQLRLSELTSIANQLSSTGLSFCQARAGDVLTMLTSLTPRMFHGLNPLLDLSMTWPKVQVDPPSGADCSDPGLADYDQRCQSDFTRYQLIGLGADQSTVLLARASIPDLPNLPSGPGCSSAALLLPVALLPGRGVVPFGFAGGLDSLEGERPNCRVGGLRGPFGSNSQPLGEGQMPVIMAPLHAGAEGSETALVVFAFDAGLARGSRQEVSAFVEHRPITPGDIDLSARVFPLYPRGSVMRAQGRLVLDAMPPASTTAVRLELVHGDATSVFYAPRLLVNDLPDPLATGVLLNADHAYLANVEIAGAFEDLWTLGSGKTLDHLPEVIAGFAVEECVEAGGPCGIQ